MFSNYFKLAIKVLRRNPFFTFISLFGISFTLMTLMLITSFLQTELGRNKPLTNKDRLVFLDRCNAVLIVKDTIYEIDSSLVDGKMKYDTINTKFDERDENNWQSSLGYYLMDKHLRNLETARDYTFYNAGAIFDVFVNNNKLTMNTVHTDDGFWRLFDFEFLEG
jgi:putative ABC transport system permease protein